MVQTEKGRKKGTESAQRDKPLDGSRGEAPSINSWLLLFVEVLLVEFFNIVLL